MNYTRKGTSYKAIQWTGKNQKEVGEFLGKKFVLKNDPIDPLKMDIYTKEKNLFLDFIFFLNSWVVMAKVKNARPEVIIEEVFPKEFVSIDKKITLKEKEEFIKEIWFIYAFSKATSESDMFWILPDEESTDKKIIELEKQFNPHADHPHWDWVFVKQKGIKFAVELSVQ